MDFAAGGRAIPGVQISVGGGRSRQEIQALVEDVKRLTQGFADLQRKAEESARAVTESTSGRITGGQSSVRAAQQRQQREQREEQRLTQQEERQADRMATADKRLQNRQQAQDYTRMRAEQRAADKELNAGLVKMREDEKKVAEARTEGHRRIMEAKEARETSTAGRLAGAVGWAPGVPQEVYMAQMALESLLPAIGGGTLLMLMGGIGAAMGGLAVANFASGQTQSGAAINAVAGLPASGPTGEFTAAGAMTAAQLRANVGTDKTAMDITTGLAQGGLPEAQSLGPAFDLAATAIHVFGVSAQEAAFFVSNSMVMLGKSVQDTAMLMEGIAATAVATGESPANLMNLAAAPDLGATVKGDTSTLSAAFLKVGGNEQGAQWLQSIALAHGLPAIALANAAGIPANQLDNLRSTPAGAAQVTQSEVNATLGRYMTSPTDEMGYTQAVKAFEAMGITPPSFTLAQRVLAQGPNALPADQQTAYQQQQATVAAEAAQSRSGAQGAHQSAIERLAAGDVSGANDTAHPLTPQQQVGLRARLAFDNTAAGDSWSGYSPPTDGGPNNVLSGFGVLAPLMGLADGILRAAPTAAQDVTTFSGLNTAVPAAASAVANTVGQGAQANVQLVKGAAEVVIRLVNDATGRTVAVQNISIPLSNGDQSQRQYTPGIPGPR